MSGTFVEKVERAKKEGPQPRKVRNPLSMIIGWVLADYIHDWSFLRCILVLRPADSPIAPSETLFPYSGQLFDGISI